MNFSQFVVTRMLEACQQYVVAKRSNLTHWHPVLGWFAQTIDTSLQDATPSVKLQLACLWTGRIVTHLIGESQFYPDTPYNLHTKVMLELTKISSLPVYF